MRRLLLLMTMMSVHALAQTQGGGGPSGGGGGSGTVTSVALKSATPNLFSGTAGAAVTTSGTLDPDAQLATQEANCEVSGPASGSPAQPTCRALVNADFPNTLAPTIAVTNMTGTGAFNTSGNAGNVTGTVSAANGGTGTTTLTGVRYANGGSADTAETGSQAATVIQGLTGCNTAGYVFTPQASDCVAQSGGGSYTTSGLTAYSVYAQGSSGPVVAYAHGQDAGSTVTISIASPAVITETNTYSAGESVVFATTGALPTGITAGTLYCVIASGLSGSQFEISTSCGGSAVNTSGTQSGTQSVQGLGTLPAFGVASSTTNLVFSGVVTNVSWTWTLSSIPQNNVVYVSDTSAGALIQGPPPATNSGHWVQKIGLVLSATSILVQPTLDVTQIL